PIEIEHEPWRRFLRHLPEAHDQAGSTGIEEGAGQTDEPLARNLFAQARFAAREDDQVGVELQGEHVGDAEPPILSSLRREEERRSLGVLFVELTVGGELDPFAARGPVPHVALVRLLADEDPDRGRRKEPGDLAPFLARLREVSGAARGVGKGEETERRDGGGGGPRARRGEPLPPPPRGGGGDGGGAPAGGQARGGRVPPP